MRVPVPCAAVAGDRRSELVDAGLALILRQRFQDLLASADSRSITEGAGVTTGSFFHHFRNRGAFTDAVASRFIERWEASADQVVADIQAFAGSEISDVRNVAQADWDKLEAAEAEATLQHLLWAARNQPLTQDGTETAGDLLARCYQYLLDAGIPAYRDAVAAMGREMMPPFDDVDLAVTMTALADGIQMRQGVQPDVVRPDLFADLVAGMLVTLTRPAGERSDDVELASLEARLLPAANRVPRKVGAGEGKTWRHIADAAAPLFDHRTVAEVKVADVAEIAGVSTRTVHHQFAAVSAVAACGWARLCPELQAIAEVPITRSQGPEVRLEQVLTRYIELGRQHRGALEGFMLEVLAVGAERDRTSERGARLAEAAPISALLTPHIRELRARGKLRRRIDSAEMAQTIVTLVSLRTFIRDEPPERILDETFGVVMEGALLGGGPGSSR